MKRELERSRGAEATTPFGLTSRNGANDPDRGCDPGTESGFVFSRTNKQKQCRARFKKEVYDGRGRACGSLDPCHS